MPKEAIKLAVFIYIWFCCTEGRREWHPQADTKQVCHVGIPMSEWPYMIQGVARGACGSSGRPQQTAPVRCARCAAGGAAARDARGRATPLALRTNERLSTMASPPDFFARTTWAGLSDVQVGKTWQQYVSATPHLAAACPKVGVGFFYYPSLKADLRGAKATAPIEKGEVICKMPISDMVSEFSVGNSSLRALAEELERESIAKHGLERTLSSSNASHATSAAMPRKRARRLRARRIDERALICLLILRETTRDRSPFMPYFSVVRSHNVDGVPALWKPDSERFRSASPTLQSMGRETRAQFEAQYRSVVPFALARFAPELSEGFGCSGVRGECDGARLRSVYSPEAFAHVSAILAARDWILPVYGQPRPFLVPTMDLLNFGQVGIRARFDDKEHAFVATASQPIAAGSEMLFYYGTMCRDGWINLYGFAPREAHECGNPRGSKPAQHK